MVMQSCPTNPELEAFAVGDCADSNAQQIELHLGVCPKCIAVLNEFTNEDSLITLARQQAKNEVQPEVTEQVQSLIQQHKAISSSSRSVGDTLAYWDDASTLKGIWDEPTRADEIGRLGTYRILQLVGSGGMGMVFRAEDSMLHRPVAIKLLRPSVAGNPKARDRFLQEARAVASLEHDHIVPIFHIGEQAGIPFFVMPFLQGESLQDRINRGEPLQEHEIRSIGIEIAKGLNAAHQHGLIHRDVKPANIWLEAETGRVKILDFGLVHMINENADQTQIGLFVGTPLFMAPEQVDGEDIDARCDLFSLGTLLYVLATGQVPFNGKSILKVLHSVCHDVPTPVTQLNPNISASLVQVIEGLHIKNPQQRLADANEVIRLLEQPAPVEPGSASRKWLLLPMFAVLIAVLGILGAFAAQLIYQDPEPVPSNVLNRANPVAKVTVPNIGGPAKAVANDPVKTAPPIYPAAVFQFTERGSEIAGLGTTVSDLLLARLLTAPDLVLVEREDLQKVLGELELNLNSAVKPANATRVGQMTGAKLLISGVVLKVDGKLHLISQIVGTETTRIAGASVKGDGPLAKLVDELATKVTATIKERAHELVAHPIPVTDRIAQWNAELGNAPRPTLILQIDEHHPEEKNSDRTIATELTKICQSVGFVVLDPELVAIGNADVVIHGKAFSQTALRRGNFISVKARVELRAVDRKSGTVLVSDQQSAIAVDLSEQIAAKTALQEATLRLAGRMLKRLVKAP